jgi:hypothetical protein
MKESDIVLHKNLDEKIFEILTHSPHEVTLLRDLKKVKLALKDRIATAAHASAQLELFREYKRKQSHYIQVSNTMLAKTERRERKRRRALELKNAVS